MTLNARKLTIALLQRKEISITIISLITISFFYSLQPKFLSPANVDVLLKITPELGIPALGVTLLMIAGEFDLSVGSVFAFTSLFTTLLLEMGVNPWLSVLLALGACSLIGLSHGLITVKTGIPSFITTLGGLLVWRGVALVITGGLPKFFAMPTEFTNIMAGKITTFLHAQMLWFFGIAIIFLLILERHKFGNWIYSTGGKKDAARAMGINTDKVKIICFILSSFTAGLGGIIQSARLNQALPNQGEGLEFDAIAAAVIGGTSLFGGAGTIIGTIIGEYLSRIIENGLIIIRAPSYYFRLYIGIVVIIAVIINLYIQRRAIRIRG
ncbi:MAG: ABC transporter permease [Nitrososphaerales archaeon]